eukprot:TRINITY_DN17817_c0_g1_i1.p1 TRINITY_DN17817_c0_g1~~TRINITY_DN17817_c0_g1_i1.p1  ORF type:complete len:269 (-),score=29.99 TRINITY_DN17817_c0_g1_i1:84-890(-)
MYGVDVNQPIGAGIHVGSSTKTGQHLTIDTVTIQAYAAYGIQLVNTHQIHIINTFLTGFKAEYNTTRSVGLHLAGNTYSVSFESSAIIYAPIGVLTDASLHTSRNFVFYFTSSRVDCAGSPFIFRDRIFASLSSFYIGGSLYDQILIDSDVPSPPPQIMIQSGMFNLAGFSCTLQSDGCMQPDPKKGCNAIRVERAGQIGISGNNFWGSQRGIYINGATHSSIFGNIFTSNMPMNVTGGMSVMGNFCTGTVTPSTYSGSGIEAYNYGC